MEQPLDPPFVHTPPQCATAPALRIAVLTTSFPLTADSPAGIFVARLFDHLPRGVNATIITPASRAVGAPFFRGDLRVVPVCYAPTRWRTLAQEPGGLPAALRRHPWLHVIVPALLGALALRLLREARGHNVIHANWAISGAIAGLVGTLAGIPVLTTLRGEDITRARRGGISRMLLAFVLRSSSAIATVSTDMAAWLKSEFPGAGHKIQAVENGVDPAFLSIVRRRPATPDPPVLTTVGSLIPRKGIDTLLRALARCLDLDWRFRIVGEGREAGALQALSHELGIAGRVFFAGSIAPGEMPAALASADIFLLGSHTEGRPNALLEAMAAGMPVIASRIDGVGELVTDGQSGLLVPAGAVDAWAAAIRRLLENPVLRDALGAEARRTILARGLTWPACAGRYVDIYRSMARQ